MRFIFFSLALFLLCSLFSLITIANCSSSLHYHACHEHESRVLLQFKQSFVISEYASYDPLSHPKTTSWISTTDCCSWHGIQCDELNGHVIGVDLKSSQLYGSLDANSSLFSLVQIQYLDLSDNDFNHSRIPSRIGEFSKLRYLNLAQSGVFGKVPQQISHLRNLLILDLSSYRDYIPSNPINKVQLKISTLTSLIQNATSLEVLGLNFVTISSSIPDTLTNLTSLQKLFLFNCELYGEFLIEKFFKLKMLNVLDLSGNKLSLLSGTSSSNETLPPIQQLGLRSCNLQGEIPSWIMNLTNLVYLDLEDNYLQGQIPHSFFRLVNLETFSLNSNSFQGEIELDMFLKLKRLTWLDLSDNKLTLLNKKGSYSNVTMPPLEVLDLSSCNISGELPSWIMNLTSLQTLDLEDNNLGGEIPRSLFTLENPTMIFLDNNLLEGQLDLDMFLKFKMLIFLGLSYNKLSLLTKKDSTNVTLPPLEGLSLASCNLLEFPPFIRELDLVQTVEVENNHLKTIPSWMWRKKNLKSLFASGNSLTGKISKLICNLKSLVILDFSYNNLSGMIPSCLGSFSQSLQALMLQGNKLGGHIPQTYAAGSNLMMIDFSNNTLKGKLPRALVNCKRLEFLDVSHNQINDSFPYWLSTLPELKVVALRSNEFHGAIMCATTCTFPKLHIIDLSHNKFSGNLAPEIIKNWKSMTASNISELQYEENTLQFPIQYLFREISYSFTMSNKGVVMDYQELQQDFYFMIAIDISGNKLFGEIPSVLGDLKRLVLLNLSNNMLSGNVPASFGKLSNLEALDLSRNHLSGEIPPQLTELTFLEFFNVSFNNLSGPIPDSKQFNTFENNSFMGNQGLCGMQVSKECEDHDKPPPPTSDGDEDSESEHFFNWKIILIGYGGGLVAGIALGSAFSHDIFMLLKRVF
ncbi:hypothetical protein PIB30_010867 [Stylosanthes scabra]|uniref:Leucine-rich repeat-containing N-terminal plant-type domain-containing protein n=1 Tax=Stylosanthes scabra TaxID=79078 RepID=A0ABU6S5H1_9FABA|nr:hypothetical protein [Stylosanthes scabra]